MSHLKSKTRPMKYDKTSIELRKEYERLAKKSKGEYESLEKDDKTELLLREGLPAQKAVPKLKEFTRTREAKPLDTNAKQKLGRHFPGDNLLHETSTHYKPKSSQVFCKSKKGDKLKKTEDLKTKPRLYEHGVVSIRPDNPDLKVVMQGKKIEKKSEDKGQVKAEEVKLESHLDYADMTLHYQTMFPFNVPTNELPAKFAITGSQKTSMQVSLALRKPKPEERVLSSATSKGTRSFEEDEAFILPW